jgi:hypothetical protein
MTQVPFFVHFKTVRLSSRLFIPGRTQEATYLIIHQPDAIHSMDKTYFPTEDVFGFQPEICSYSSGYLTGYLK